MKKIQLGAFVLALVPGVVMAAVPKPAPVPGGERPSTYVPGGGYASLYYIPSANVDSGGTSFDGNGFGVNGFLPLAIELPLFVLGEYQQAKIKNTGTTEKDLRLGLGYQFNPIVGAYAEYASFKFGNTLSGFGVHGRLSTHNESAVNFFGDLGYLDLKNDKGPDVNGLEYIVGGNYRINPQFSGFADYEYTKLSTKSGNAPDLTLDKFRIGVQFYF